MRHLPHAAQLARRHAQPRGGQCQRLHELPRARRPGLGAPDVWTRTHFGSLSAVTAPRLGATAIRAVLGRALPILANRGTLVDLSPTTRVLVTVHPSYLLRVPPSSLTPLMEYAEKVLQPENPEIVPSRNSAVNASVSAEASPSAPSRGP